MNYPSMVRVGLFGLALVMGCKGASKAKEDPAGETATPVAAAVLMSEYKANEVRADGVYKGKRLQLTGVVGDIKKDFTDSIYVTVGTGAQFEINAAHCSFDDKYTKEASELSKGATVTVDCKCAGLVALSVVMKDCRFVHGANGASASATPPSAASTTAAPLTSAGVCAKLAAAGVAKNCSQPAGPTNQVHFDIATAPGKSANLVHFDSDKEYAKFLAVTSATPPTSALRPFVTSESSRVVVFLGKGMPADVEPRVKAALASL